MIGTCNLAGYWDGVHWPVLTPVSAVNIPSRLEVLFISRSGMEYYVRLFLLKAVF